MQRREHEQYLKNSSSESPLIGRTKKNKELALNSSSQGTNVAERNFGSEKTHKSHTRKGKAIDGRSSKQHSFQETFSGTCDSASGRIHSEPTAQTGFFRAKTNFNSQATNSNFDYKSATSSTQNISKQSQDSHGNYASFLRPNTSLSNVVHTKQNNISKRSPIGFNHLGNRKDLAKRRFLAVNPLTQKKVQPEEELCDVFENEQNSVSSTQNSTAQQELSEYDKLDQTSKALYVSKLRQLGWILGLDGKWQKDENVEFDSDEDESPSPKSIL